MNRDERAKMAEPRSELAILKDRLHRYETCGIVELAAINPNVRSYMDEWERRATRAEAALQRRNEMDMAMTPSGSGDR